MRMRDIESEHTNCCRRAIGSSLASYWIHSSYRSSVKRKLVVLHYQIP